MALTPICLDQEAKTVVPSVLCEVANGTGNALAMHWQCTGNALAMHWQCTGNSTGNALPIALSMHCQ